ncbi:MAG TPA: hypothetical protein VHZ51_12585 [Ktedonobacteraceae bacterium]|jgi:hypothetical protein|nr:hypothetical protein [Ktedonobacteraceae bacterium]
MGVERSVTRWYAQRQRILGEIAALQAQCEQVTVAKPEKMNVSSLTDMNVQLKQAQERLRSLGPCPKPMMG